MLIKITSILFQVVRYSKFGQVVILLYDFFSFLFVNGIVMLPMFVFPL